MVQIGDEILDPQSYCFVQSGINMSMHVYMCADYDTVSEQNRMIYPYGWIFAKHFHEFEF